MKKIKGFFFLALCALVALSSRAQINTAQDVIDRLTANGGHCQTLYYSASYQEDYGEVNRKSTNNMWVKDSFGKAHFVDAHRSENVYGVGCKVVTLVDAFGGLFDWDFYIDDRTGSYMMTYQYYDQTYQAKGAGNENKYVRLHMMSGSPETWAVVTTDPHKKVSEFEFESAEAVQLWTSFHDGVNFNIIGTPSWEHETFDASLYLSPFFGMRWYFLRLAVKEGSWQNPQDDDREISHYDFYLAEFRHYNPNIVVNDAHNGEERSFEAIADFVTEPNGENTQFWIHNFSGFGPLYTQTLGAQKDADLDQLLAGTGLTQVDRGYGEGQVAEIHPLTGHLYSDGNILIKRADNPAGYTHYHRAYEAVKNVEGVTDKQIATNKFNPAITLWHDNRIAGLVEGAYSRDAEGHIIPESITALKDEVTGTWTGGQHHYHKDLGKDSEASNPWVSDGGSCRTISTLKMKINPYVYCTDEQLEAGKNGTATGLALYDSDDDHARGGIYELINIETTQKAEDITLQLNIDHEALAKSIYQYEYTKKENNVSTTTYHIACPVTFDLAKNEQLSKNDQFVDHFEVCAYLSPIGVQTGVTDASDAEFANENSLLNQIMAHPAATYTLAKNETGHYEAFEGADNSNASRAASIDLTNDTRYSKVFSINLGTESIKDKPFALTFYVKAVYTEESGLAPTYHSLQNVIFEESIPTGVTDVNSGGVKAVAGVYSITGQYLGSQVPEGRGVFVVRYTDGSAAKVAVK